MKTNNHAAFQDFLKQREEVSEAHRISGEGCYLLKVSVTSAEELSRLLDDILRYANYRVNISIGTVK
jgi:Lrp/AsnC family leucine-responsive transcriptional regulator